MQNPPFTSTEIAEALQHHYEFSPQKAYTLATAGPEQIRSPWTVPGMDVLIARLVQALRRRNPILVFGDFDTDGIAGSAVLFQVLSGYSGQVRRYNPLYREGYGLHVDQVERFARQGVQVVVTVDTGTTSHEAVQRAGQLGLDILITDHHLPRRDLGPPNTVFVNPPDHLLAGAQLAYLVGQALRERMEGSVAHDPWGLALAAVGAQTDWIPVDRAETRAWVALAQRVIHSPECPAGLRALQEEQREPYVSSDLLSLGGVLNMAKRSHLVDPNAIVDALLPGTADEKRREVYRFLLQEGSRCRRVAAEITAQALEDVRRQANRPGLLIYAVSVPDETLAEVEGPLASRIVRVTGRPALVLRLAEERVRFSGRARGGFSFESLLSDPEVVSLVIDMGGHRQAIGGSFWPQYQQTFLEAISRWEQRHSPVEAASSDERLPHVLERLDPATAYLLGRAMGPFGHRLRRPRFRTTLSTKGGWAFSGDCLVETDRVLDTGEWEVTFRFDEAGCDGERVVLRVGQAQRVE